MQVVHKYSRELMELFTDAFRWLPLSHTLNGKVLVLHGGLFSKDETNLEDLKKIDRHCEPPDESCPMTELLWSDPINVPGRQPSKRGVGVAFGPDVATRFLEANGLEMLVRSHECKDEGYEIDHDGKTVTVFSAPNYCDQVSTLPHPHTFDFLCTNGPTPVDVKIPTDPSVHVCMLRTAGVSSQMHCTRPACHNAHGWPVIR